MSSICRLMSAGRIDVRFSPLSGSTSLSRMWVRSARRGLMFGSSWRCALVQGARLRASRILFSMIDGSVSRRRPVLEHHVDRLHRCQRRMFNCRNRSNRKNQTGCAVIFITPACASASTCSRHEAAQHARRTVWAGAVAAQAHSSGSRRRQRSPGSVMLCFTAYCMHRAGSATGLRSRSRRFHAPDDRGSDRRCGRGATASSLPMAV
jgi:hypothetical protein